MLRMDRAQKGAGYREKIGQLECSSGNYERQFSLFELTSGRENLKLELLAKDEESVLAFKVDDRDTRYEPRFLSLTKSRYSP